MDVQRIARLLEASLDPKQNKQGMFETQSHCPSYFFLIRQNYAGCKPIFTFPFDWYSTFAAGNRWESYVCDLGSQRNVLLD